jgi:hypothetical protein
LDVVVREGAAVFELLAGEDQALLVRRDAFFVLDLGLDVVDRVGRFDLESDGLAREGLDEAGESVNCGFKSWWMRGSSHLHCRGEKCQLGLDQGRVVKRAVDEVLLVAIYRQCCYDGCWGLEDSEVRRRKSLVMRKTLKCQECCFAPQALRPNLAIRPFWLKLLIFSS